MALTTDHPATAQEGRRASSVTERPAPVASARRDNALFLTAAFSSLALIVAMVAVGFGARAIDESKRAGGGEAAGAAPAVATVHLTDFAIAPTEVVVATGGSLQIMNMGGMAHNLAVKDTQAASPMIDAGGTGALNLGALSAGTYTIYCQVPGHEQLGMTAKLRIVNAPGGTASSATTPPTASAMTVEEMDAMMAKSIKAFPAKTQGQGAQLLAATVLADGTKQFELTASIVKWEVEPGRFVDAWTYNGTVSGPTIKVQPGDRVSVLLHNQLPESTAIHFHGIITPKAMDGVPGITQDPIKPGQTFTYRFTAQTTPAVGMYHSHQDAVKQVPNGLAGAFLIGQEPAPEGVVVSQEDVMMLNDAGTLGLTLNGKSFPATAPVTAKLGDWVEVH